MFSSCSSFTFFPLNHTVTQSSFDSPCSKLVSPFNDDIDTAFDTAFTNPTDDATGGGPILAHTISAGPDVPLWFYCRQTVPVSHCKKGVVASWPPSRLSRRSPLTLCT